MPQDHLTDVNPTEESGINSKIEKQRTQVCESLKQALSLCTHEAIELCENHWSSYPNLGDGLKALLPQGLRHASEGRLWRNNVAEAKKLLEAYLNLIKAQKIKLLDPNDPRFRSISPNSIEANDFFVFLETPWLMIDGYDGITNVGFLEGKNLSSFLKNGVLLGGPLYPRSGVTPDSYDPQTMAQDILKEPLCKARTVLNKWDRERVVTMARARRYVAMCLASIYTEHTVVALRWANIGSILQQGFDMGQEIDTIIGRVTDPEERSILSQYRHNTPENIQKLVREKTTELDQKRFQMHRKIEAFCFVWLEGMNRLQVANMIDSHLLVLTHGAREITSGIMMKVEKNTLGRIPSVECAIVFGKGGYFRDENLDDVYEEDSVDGMSKNADGNTYESLVAPGRTLDHDWELACTIQEKVRSQYPLITCHNDLAVQGGGHISYAGNELIFSAESILMQAKAINTPIEDLIQAIASIATEEITNARNAWQPSPVQQSS